MSRYENAFQRYCKAYDVVHPWPLDHDPRIMHTNKATTEELTELSNALAALRREERSFYDDD